MIHVFDCRKARPAPLRRDHGSTINNNKRARIEDTINRRGKKKLLTKKGMPNNRICNIPPPLKKMNHTMNSFK